MGGLLLAVVLANPDAAACREALRPEPGALAQRAQVMVQACGALISKPWCRETFRRFHAVGQRPVPLREVVVACWSSYCRWDVETPCDAAPAWNPAELWNRWTALERAIWRHEAPVEAEVIRRRFEEGSWSKKASDEAIGSMALHVQGEGVVLVARFGPREQQWRMPPKPRDEDYVAVQGWLEREVTTSGRVALAAEPPVLFAHVKMLMATVFAAGQPVISFRVLR